MIANSRGPETLADVAAETGAKAVTAKEATRGNDLLVVTIPQKAVPDLPGASSLTSRRTSSSSIRAITIPFATDTSRRPTSGVPESAWVAKYLGRPVVKAFNNIASASLRDKALPAKSAGRVAIPVAGDDARAKATAMALVEEIGFDAVDSGSIAESWRQEPGTPCYAADLDAAGLKAALAAAKHEGRADCRASADGYLATLNA